MLSVNELKRYRRAGAEKRYEWFLELASWSWEALEDDPEDVREKRWALIRKQHEEGSLRLVRKFGTLP
jgi:hypothetical protein